MDHYSNLLNGYDYNICNVRIFKTENNEKKFMAFDSGCLNLGFRGL